MKNKTLRVGSSGAGASDVVTTKSFDYCPQKIINNSSKFQYNDTRYLDALASLFSVQDPCCAISFFPSREVVLSMAEGHAVARQAWPEDGVFYISYNHTNTTSTAFKINKISELISSSARAMDTEDKTPAVNLLALHLLSNIEFTSFLEGDKNALEFLDLDLAALALKISTPPVAAAAASTNTAVHLLGVRDQIGAILGKLSAFSKMLKSCAMHYEAFIAKSTSKKASEPDKAIEIDRALLHKISSPSAEKHPKKCEVCDKKNGHHAIKLESFSKSMVCEYMSILHELNSIKCDTGAFALLKSNILRPLFDVSKISQFFGNNHKDVIMEIKYIPSPSALKSGKACDHNAYKSLTSSAGVENELSYKFISSYNDPLGASTVHCEVNVRDFFIFRLKTMGIPEAKAIEMVEKLYIGVSRLSCITCHETLSSADNHLGCHVAPFPNLMTAFCRDKALYVPEGYIPEVDDAQQADRGTRFQIRQLSQDTGDLGKAPREFVRDIFKKLFEASDTSADAASASSEASENVLMLRSIEDLIASVTHPATHCQSSSPESASFASDGSFDDASPALLSPLSDFSLLSSASSASQSPVSEYYPDDVSDDVDLWCESHGYSAIAIDLSGQILDS